MIVEEKSLKALGVSAKIATGLIFLGVMATLYKNYYEMKKTKLQIKLMTFELNKINKEKVGA